MGPGYYDTSESNDIKFKVSGNARNKDKTFGVSKRDTFGEAKSSLAPGPGHYSQGLNGEINEWYKKTFNYRYLKQYHQGDPVNVSFGMGGIHEGIGFPGGIRAKSHLAN